MAKCCSFLNFFEFLHTISKKLMFSEKTNIANARLNDLNAGAKTLPVAALSLVYSTPEYAQQSGAAALTLAS